MVTIDVDDKTNEKIETLQEELPWNPTKKDIVSKAVGEFKERELKETHNNE